MNSEGKQTNKQTNEKPNSDFLRLYPKSRRKGPPRQRPEPHRRPGGDYCFSRSLQHRWARRDAEGLLAAGTHRAWTERAGEGAWSLRSVTETRVDGRGAALSTCRQALREGCIATVTAMRLEAPRGPSDPAEPPSAGAGPMGTYSLRAASAGAAAPHSAAVLPDGQRERLCSRLCAVPSLGGAWLGPLCALPSGIYGQG